MRWGNGGDDAAQISRPAVASTHLRRIVTSYALTKITSIEYVPQGLMNDSWRVATATEVYALKRYRKVDPHIISRNLGAVAYAKTAGLPACAPVLTTTGAPIVSVDDHHYALFPWVFGHHRVGVQLSDSQLEAHGQCLGDIHLALNDARSPLPQSPTKMDLPILGMEATIKDVDRMRRTVEQRWAGSSFAGLVSGALTRRRELISDHADLAPTTQRNTAYAGWTHGDYLLKNVLWIDDTIVGVLDWDWVDIRPLATELVRSAFKVFVLPDGRLDLNKVRSFVRGYRAVFEMPSQELDDAAVRLWWDRLGNTWQLSHRLENDDTLFDTSFVTSCRLAEWLTSHLDEVRHAFAAA